MKRLRTALQTLPSLACQWVCLLTLTASTLPALAAQPQDWPQFRGPNRDGISTEVGLLKAWPAEGPQVAFRVPLGKGFSGLSIVQGRIYTLISQGGSEFLLALEAQTGKEIWRFRTDAERSDNFGDGPRSTPLVDADRVYAVSALGKLYALERASGKLLFSHDLTKEFGGVVPNWGVSASPIVEGNLLLFNVGGKPGFAIVAFDKASGEVKWKTGSDIPGYSNPLAITVGGMRQIIFFSGTQLLAVAPQDGKVLWQQPWKTSYDINAAAPLFIPPNQLFVSSGYDVGATLFAIQVQDGQASAQQVWQNRGMKNQFSSSVFHNGYIYGFDNKTLKCIDVKTGEDKWRTSGFGHGSLFYADGHLVVLGDNGKLALVEATPAGYSEKATAQPLAGKHWTVPTLYGGRLYIRNESELIALQVSG